VPSRAASPREGNGSECKTETPNHPQEESTTQASRAGSVTAMVADRVVQKYQGSTCEQLWQKKSEPKSMEEQRVLSLLQSDPQMRATFINKVAAPIANKMFECGMIP
jgi:hypothetical protein